MAENTVTVSGMFGGGKTYFADSPVVITVSGLEWPTDAGGKPTSPFNIVRVDVVYLEEVGGGSVNRTKVGDFHADTGGQGSIDFNISSALRAMWADYGFSREVAAAGASSSGEEQRGYRSYSLFVHTEYIAADGVFERTDSPEIEGGRCCLGGLTEWERSLIEDRSDADVSYWEGSNPRNGDASTKPVSTPERVGSTSRTSWVDVNPQGTRSVFFPADATPAEDGPSAHAPIVLRDSQPYADFLFVNRRGAVETCSGQAKEAMAVEVETKQYGRVERPSFTPSRSLTAVASGGRRSWQMSSGYQTREWADWWTHEFLMARRWWMLWQGPGMDAADYVPVTVAPAKKSQTVYDLSKQQYASVEFTVTLALEG